jgi:hypothetical protein
MGEIFPQAYFSRNAMRLASLFAPLLKFYQFLLYPVAKPTAVMLDMLLGKEMITFYREDDLRILLKKHIVSKDTDIDRLEGIGALNFLALDDLGVAEEGEHVDPDSIISLPTEKDIPVFPEFERHSGDPFLQKIHESGKKWVIITDESGEPLLVLDADRFLREIFFLKDQLSPIHYCHRPIIVTDLTQHLGKAVSQLNVHSQHPEDDVIDHDVILLWGKEKKVITGADLLGRLLRGISNKTLTDGYSA